MALVARLILCASSRVAALLGLARETPFSLLRRSTEAQQRLTSSASQTFGAPCSHVKSASFAMALRGRSPQATLIALNGSELSRARAQLPQATCWASDPLAAEVTTPTGFIMTFQCQACPLQSFASRLRQTSDACFDAHGESRQCSPGGWRECRDPISGRRILAWRFTEQTDTNGACIVLRLSVWIFFPRILEPCEHESYKLELG